MSEAQPRRPVLEIILVAVVLLAGLALLYGNALQAGLPRVSGDLYDGRIYIAVLEHWFGVVSGDHSPLSPPYFYPYPYTLSFGDGLVVAGLIYAVPRAVGFDPFVSYEISNAVICSIGFVGAYAVARRLLGVSIVFALFAALVALLANSLTIRSVHAQLLFAAFFPIGILLVWPLFLGLTSSGGRSPRSTGTMLAAVGAVVFFFVWAMTSFYSLFAFVLFTLVVMATAMIADPALRGRVWQALRRPSPALIVLAAGFAVAAVAVFALYSQSGHSGHSVSGMWHGARPVIELINVGGSNWIWGDLMGPLMGLSETANPNDPYGFSPVFLAAFLLCTVWLVIACRRDRPTVDGAGADRRVLALGLAAGAVVLGLCAVRIGGFALFQPLFVAIPGGSAIRLPVRFLLFAGPVVALVTAYGLDAAARRGWVPALAAVAVAVFILLEQGHDESTLRLDRHAEQAFLESVPEPPEGCRSFYVYEPRVGPFGNEAMDRYYSHGVDAMLLGSYLRLPTVNGMATFTPVGWTLAGPFEPDYLDRVAAYAERHGISDGQCGLSLKESRWVEGVPGQATR
ncbi:hypothetical protein [Amorphus orientalis]|uniref:Uncharacterized protein n=1 Tax=Amorphus orientalis TaxID=649198 RepID=A0AAE3VPH2_9HYPH|nr:hypothetical protein [Amorphus orientalis]MDQ0316434.1 hypothetical protein [Amorphus orientalis]